MLYYILISKNIFTKNYIKKLEMKSKKIICLTGPSGIGKTSYKEKLIKKYKFLSPTVVTTRPKRIDDNNYIYVSKKLFSKMIKNKLFIEWDEYINNYYGVLFSSFEKLLKLKNTKGIILDLTPQGCIKIKQEQPSTIIIALLPDDSEWLLKRLEERNLQLPNEILERNYILNDYIKEVKKLSCNIVYVSYSENSWEPTFKKIEKIIFQKTK